MKNHFPVLTLLLIVSLVLGLSADAARAAGPSFQGIGIDAGSGSEGVGSLVQGISSDGRVVVGSLIELPTPSEAEVVAWTREQGLHVLLGDPPARPGWSSQVGAPFTGAHASSADGSVIVGSRRREARVWTAPTGLTNRTLNGDLPIAGQMILQAVSEDGRTVGGWYGPNNTAPVYHSETTGWVRILLPDISLPPYGEVNALSADGHYAFGWAEERRTLIPDDDPVPDFGRAAFRWSVDGGLERITAPSIDDASVEAASADGEIAVGHQEGRAHLWNLATGASISLGELDPIAGAGSRALDVSALGDIVVGSSSAGAFIWDAENGMRLVADVLAGALGLDLEGWTLTDAAAISADGRVIAGNGFNPDGVREGWVAVIPEPSTGLLLGMGLGVLGARRRSNRGAVVYMADRSC